MPENYFVPLYMKRTRPLQLPLAEIKKRVYVFWSAFFPMDETDVPKGELQLRTFKPGALAIVFLDFYKLRLRLKILTKIGLPLGQGVQVQYDEQALMRGEAAMSNIFGVRVQIPPYVNTDISRTLVEERGTYGLMLDSSAEAKAFAALALFINSKWGSASNLLADIEAQNKEAIDALKQLYAGDISKLLPLAQRWGIRFIA